MRSLWIKVVLNPQINPYRTHQAGRKPCDDGSSESTSQEHLRVFRSHQKLGETQNRFTYKSPGDLTPLTPDSDFRSLKSFCCRKAVI